MYCFYFKSNHCPQDFINILYLLSISQSLKEVDLKVLLIKKSPIYDLSNFLIDLKLS